MRKRFDFMHTLPPNAPANLYEAFPYIGSVTNPSIEDLKLMVILEAAGKVMYDDLAATDVHLNVQAILTASGLDELKHAERLSVAIGKLTGDCYPVPQREENPSLTDWVKPQLTPELLKNLAQAEFGGEALYEAWAQHCPRSEAATLFRLNGGEETQHGLRLEVIAMLLACR